VAFRRFLAKSIAFILVIVASISKLLVWLIDFFIPRKLQELIPIIDVQRTFLLYGSQMLTPPVKKELEEAIENLQSVTGQVEEIAKGYAIRKAIGQSVDYALSFAVLGGLGVARWLVQHNISPILIALFASSATVLIATLAGFFGPIYELSKQSKILCLKHGAYRGASMYKKLENIFGVPFMVAKSSFIILDTPPVDNETLEEFKEELSTKLNKVEHSLKSLLGQDDADIPETTRQLLEELLQKAEIELKSLNYEQLKTEIAREFAMIYFEQEFSLLPWKRKRALKQFAKKMGLSIRDAETLLRLLSFKLEYGQVDSDFVQSILISGAAKGIIEKEQEYHEMFEDVEMNQVAIGLAIGAIRFLLDHYQPPQPITKRIAKRIKHFFISIFAMPWVLILSIRSWFSHLNKMSKITIFHIKNNTPKKWMAIRYREISTQLENIFNELPDKFVFWKKEDNNEKEQVINEEKKKSLRWRVSHSIWVGIKLVLAFIFIIPLGILKIIRWFIRLFITTEDDVRKKFQSEVAHSALVSMYIELYEKLSLGSYITSAY